MPESSNVTPLWEQRLVRNERDGSVKASAHNLMTVLENHEAWAGLFQLNEFSQKISMTGDPPYPGADPTEFSTVDATEIAAWFGRPETYGINVKSSMVTEVVEAVARRNKVHPVREYLEGLIWDGTERLPTLFSDFFGTVQDDYTARVGVMFALSAVARILQPGCKVDTMVVLEGRQGIGKTQAVRHLFSPPWYAEAQESPQSKDFYQSLHGRWGVEIGEMHSFTKGEVTKVKQAISAQSDVYRPSYGRYAREFPRQCVFVGTTNDRHYLRDHTGGRRFLPIAAKEVDRDGLISVRDQIWAEAVARYKRGEQWHELPPDASAIQDERYQEDAWSEPIRDWLAGEGKESSYPADSPNLEYHDEDIGGVKRVTTSLIMKHALGIETAKHTRQDQMRVSSVMQHLGWDQRRVGKLRTRMWEQEGRE